MGGFHNSLLHFIQSCISTLFSPHPSSPPDSMSSSFLLYPLQRPHHTACFSSSSRHHIYVIHVPATSTYFSSISIFSLSFILGTLSLRDTLYIHHIILISVRSNHPTCSAFMAQLSLPYPIALHRHLTYIFLF